MKKQIALVLAGSAAAVAGGLRMIQDLVHRDESHSHGAEPAPGAQTVSAPRPAPSSAVPAAVPAPDESAKPEPAGQDLAGSSKADLYGMATELKISGRSKMGKAELITAIEAAS